MLKIVPENLQVANIYLETDSMQETAYKLDIPLNKVEEILNTAEVKRYIDTVYLDTGYRNKNKLAQVLDKMIDAKIDAGEYSSDKDLLDLLKFSHQLRIDEEKKSIPASQTNVQINEFGEGNYADLLKRLIS
jgi:hypothetical protein